MKKLLFIFGLILISTILFSCTESSNYTIDQLLDQINVIYAQGDHEDSVTTHVTLPSQTDLNKSASLIWVSDTPTVLDSYGTVNRPDEITEVTLTLILTLSGETREKNVNLTVLGLYQYFMVTFKVNEVIIDSIKVKENETVAPVPNPIITDYTFKGWFTLEDRENAFDFDTPITNHVNLIAKLDLFILADYRIEYYHENLEDDAYKLVSTETFNGEVGVEVNVSAELVGFSINAEQSVLTGIIAENDALVLKVYSERDLHQVTFVSEDIELSSVQKKFGSTLNEILDPIREEYIFLGWSATINGETPYDFPTTIISHMTFYALWRFDDGTIYTGYYEGADGLSGTDLKSFLNLRVNTGTTMINYGDARYHLDDSDRDPNNPNNVILVYLGTSVSGVWDFGATWNREHVWPQSLLVSDAENSVINVASDLHNLKPANPSENSRRSNKFFDYTTTTSSYAPRDAVKGDVARILLHMDVAYTNLTLVNTTPTTYQMGKLSTLLQWHLQDPVDDFERNRNNVIYSVQKNRNPFIDHPEFVEMVWGPIVLTASNNESYKVNIDFTSLFDVLEIISYEIIYVEVKKESQYLM